MQKPLLNIIEPQVVKQQKIYELTSLIKSDYRQLKTHIIAARQFSLLMKFANSEWCKIKTTYCTIQYTSSVRKRPKICN